MEKEVITEIQVMKMEVNHHQFNLNKVDNLNTVPAREAVYGIFSIVDDQPMNCRFVGQSDNLQKSIRELFENPVGIGLQKFMQGPWIKMLVYHLVSPVNSDRQKLYNDFLAEYQPKLDDEGDYPSYYN